jgi:hypothetical protein
MTDESSGTTADSSVMREGGTATSRKLWKEYLSFNPCMDSGETQKVTSILMKEGDRP